MKPSAASGRGTVTPDELRAMATTAGGKYNARRTYVPELERWFASAREAEVAVTLRRREQAGEIRGLAFQPRYRLAVNGVHVCDYVGDFAYEERVDEWWGVRRAGWRAVTADAKGFRTPVYKLKKALVRAVLGIDVQEL